MGAKIITGWEPEKRTHFDEIVVKYDKIRPTYPERLFADVIDFAGVGKTKALEIGAGTGKATTPFLKKGYDVTVVEIGENMAEFLREKFKNYKNFNVIVSAFEDAVLDESNYDLIYAASAFHWVDAEIGCPKVFRLLKNGGVFAMFRYNVLSEDNDVLCDEIETVYDKYYRSYYTSKKRQVRISRSHDEFKEPSEILANYGFKDLKNYGFKDVLMKFYDFTRTFDADEYIDLLDTMADHRSLPEGNRAALYIGIKEAILRHGGHHTVNYVFQLYTGKRL